MSLFTCANLTCSNEVPLPSVDEVSLRLTLLLLRRRKDDGFGVREKVKVRGKINK